jgi:ribosomal protein S25
MDEEALREDILKEVERCKMVETTYIARRFSITTKSAIYHLKRLEAMGKIRFVPCGKWYIKE